MFAAAMKITFILTLIKLHLDRFWLIQQAKFQQVRNTLFVMGGGADSLCEFEAATSCAKTAHPEAPAVLDNKM